MCQSQTSSRSCGNQVSLLRADADKELPNMLRNVRDVSVFVGVMIYVVRSPACCVYGGKARATCLKGKGNMPWTCSPPHLMGSLAKPGVLGTVKGCSISSVLASQFGPRSCRLKTAPLGTSGTGSPLLLDRNHRGRCRDDPRPLHCIRNVDPNRGGDSVGEQRSKAECPAG
jgi:hypothetical protein